MEVTIQIVEDEYDSHRVAIETDNADYLNNALNQHETTSRIETNKETPSYYSKISSALGRIFKNHAEFYDHVGFDSGVIHGGTGTNFYRDGFKQFLEDHYGIDTGDFSVKYDEHDQFHQDVVDAINMKIQTVLETHEPEQGVQARSTLSLTENDTKLTDPSMLDDAVIVTEDNAYKLQANEVNEIDSINDMAEEVRNRHRDIYQRQVNARTASLREQVRELQEQLEENDRETLIQGIELLKDDDWVVREINGDTWLVYPGRIHVKKATKKYTDNDTVHTLTDEAQERFWVDRPRVRLDPQVRKIRYDDANHPHALSSGICIGRFRNMDIEKAIPQVKEQLQQANLHEYSNTDAESDLKTNFDEYTTDNEEDNGTVFSA